MLVGMFLVFAGCGQEAGPLLSGAAFVALPVTVKGDQMFAQGQVSPDGTEFLLAINRDQLGNRFFFTATVSQWVENAQAVGSPTWTPPFPLFTAIVTFQIHDGRLYVIDASHQFDFSNAQNPEVVIDSYEIVKDSSFDNMQDHEKYVLINPAAGDNLRYVDQSPVFGPSYNCANCFDSPRITLSFAQKFHATQDASGATSAVLFDQVVAGVVDSTNFPNFDPSTANFNNLTTNQSDTKFYGTLGISIRPYFESAGFEPTLIDLNNYPSRLYFITSSFLPVPNQGDFTIPIYKWNIHPGMTPVEWVISDEVYNDPRSSTYDLPGVIKQGIEDWNSIFGYPVFHASVGNIADAMRDDTKSIFVYDNNPLGQYAFMAATFNPDTGEARRGYIYMPSSFLDSAELSAGFHGLSTPARTPETSARLLGWNHRPSLIGCAYRPSSEADAVRLAPSATNDPTLPGTKKDYVQRAIRDSVNHETGHNLGLQHNFEGSLSEGSLTVTTAPFQIYPAGISSTVMDYLNLDDRVRMASQGPLGTYDAAAMNFLYGGGPEPASFPFCSNQDIFNGADPNCTFYDLGQDPLHDYYNILYTRRVDHFHCPAFCSGPVLSVFDFYLNKVLQYLRADPDSGRRQDAWNIAFGPARTPSAGREAELDALADAVIRRVLLDPPELRGNWTADPSSDDVAAFIIPDLQATLTDAGAIRSFDTRRACVDALKRVQLTPALDALLAARSAIAAARASLTGDQGALTDDLLARIDSAIHPYFN
jgi:hypothetical protein